MQKKGDFDKAHMAFAKACGKEHGCDITTNPPVSKAQARLMRAVAGGGVQLPGLSPAQAKEYVAGTPTRNLPERVKRKK